MVRWLMALGGAVLLTGVTLLAIGLVGYLAGFTWVALATGEGRPATSIAQVTYQVQTLQMLAIYLAGLGGVLALIGALTGGFGYMRFRSDMPAPGSAIDASRVARDKQRQGRK